MLFDLRGRGRRRTVQVIYLSLALLLGGGLVLFGIGGDVQGGLFDAFRENSGSESEALQDDVDTWQERVDANPENAAAWAELARAKFNLAGQTEGFNEATGEFNDQAREVVVEATRAWERHLALAKDNPDAEVAQRLTQAYLALGQTEKAFETQQIVFESIDDPASGQFATYAQYAYLAGKTIVGDRAARRALEVAKEDGESKERRDELKASLDAIKQQAAQQAAQEAQQGAAPPQPISP